MPILKSKITHLRLYLFPFFVGLICISPGCQNSVLKNSTTPADDSAPTERLIRDLRRLPTVRSVDIWTLPEVIRDRDRDGLTITPHHYQIHTSVRDPLILRQVPVFIESAFRSYSELVD